MAKSLQVWENNTLNNQVDLDNQSYDCVDVPKSWAEYLTDKPWTTSLAWGNAKDLYNNVGDTYWDHIPRGNAPLAGDIVVMNGSIGGGYGHTGVVVSVDGNNITIYQQNTFTQQPVYTGVYNAYVSYITGYLRPKTAFTLGAETTPACYQRVASYAAKYRDAASTSATVLQQFTAGELYDFKGFVHGENVDGNDVWFVGRYTGGYAWSGAFDDKDTHDLPDLTPATAPTLESYQRVVGNSVINFRSAPLVAPDNVIRTFDPAEVLDFDAFSHGSLVNGSDIWFRGRYSGGWAHSGGFTDTGTHDLTEVKLDVVATPVTDSVDLSKKVVDLSSHNKVSDYPALKSAVRGVIARAGHTGKSYGGVQPLNGDPSFATSKAALGEKLVGAYWYGYASLDPEDEADAFVSTVGTVGSDFTYWLDIEEADGQSSAKINDWCEAFCAEVDKLTNRVTGLYMNQNWYNTVIDVDTKGTRPVWLASFDIPENTAIVPNQVAHQYTSKGAVNGVEGYVDINAVTDAFFNPTIIKPVVTTPVVTTPYVPPVDTVTTLIDKLAKIFAFILAKLFNKKK